VEFPLLEDFGHSTAARLGATLKSGAKSAV
jgi:hypothetical protein